MAGITSRTLLLSRRRCDYGTPSHVGQGRGDLIYPVGQQSLSVECLGELGQRWAIYGLIHELVQSVGVRYGVDLISDRL